MKYILKKQVPDEQATSGFKIIEVEAVPERWVWGVEYKDNTELHQFGDDGTFHQVGEIRQDEIKMATLYRFGDMTRRIDIPWRPGMRLIHKYRVFILEQGTPQERKVQVYIFGYKYRDTYHYAYVLPDDRIVESPEDDVDLMKFGI